MELPRDKVTNYLEAIDPMLAIRYIRFLIDERAEVDAGYHDRLASLLLGSVKDAFKKGDQGLFSSRSKLGSGYLMRS